MTPELNEKLDAIRGRLEARGLNDNSPAAQMRAATKMLDTAEDLSALFKKFYEYFSDTEGPDEHVFSDTGEPLTWAMQATEKALDELLKTSQKFRQAVMNKHHG